VSDLDDRVVRVAAVGDLHVGLDLADQRTLVTSEDADLLLLAGDLTRHGTRDEVDYLVAVLSLVEVPIIAVLGNHDHHAGRPDEVRGQLESSGVTVLECESTMVDVRGHRVAVVGAKGFAGGFAGRCATEFGEPEMKLFVAHTRNIAVRLQHALSEVDADLRIVLYHYSPIPETLMGEPLEIYPFLGSYLLAEAVDHGGGADLVLHGHAHAGSERGRTPGGVPVRNVARPVIRRSHRIFDLHVDDGAMVRHLTSSAATTVGS
jgi:Icc-related predicted phosphoesterase